MPEAVQPANYYRDHTWSVRVARGLQELALRVDRVVSDYSACHGRQPTVAEITAIVGATDEDALEALQARNAHHASSLDAPAAASTRTISPARVAPGGRRRVRHAVTWLLTGRTVDAADPRAA
jgi:DNA-directed RNA polymerase specialized sigma subunit